MPQLDTAVAIGRRTAANRLVLAPMTDEQRHDDGSLSQAEISWLALRAHGGFGTLLTGAYAVAPRGRVWHGQAAA